MSVELESDLSILRLASFGDIEVGHDLDARHEGAPVGGGKSRIGEAGAIDPEPYIHLSFPHARLEMEIGGAQTIGFRDQVTGQPQDRKSVV